MKLYAMIALASLIAGTLDTVTGFGGALLLMPILVMLVGAKKAILLGALISLGWNIPRIILLREWIAWRAVGLFALGIVPGAYIGALLLGVVDPKALELTIGISLLLLGGYYIVRMYVDLPRASKLPTWTFPLCGLVSGVVAGILGAGHGPLQAGALTAASMSVREVAATNGALGGLTALARIAGYGIEGMLGPDLWLPGAIGIVFAAAGAYLGVDLSRRSKDATLELVVAIVIVVAGIKMVATAP